MTTRARHRRLPTTLPATLLAGALVTVSTVALVTAGAPPAFALDPVNPVVVTPGDPANSGFLVFVEGDVTLRSDESEGTVAMGGDLHVQSTYNIAAGAAPVTPTYTAPGDARPTYLHVGGGIGWDDPNAVVNVENGGFTKVADTTTYDAFDRDSNNAAADYRLVPQGRPFEAVPHIQGRTRQTPASIGTPVPTSLIDIPSAFATYRDLTQQMAQCPVNVPLLNRDDGTPLPRPVPAGANARVSLTPGVTNVLTLSALELAHLSEITFGNQPSASTPLLVNVTGSTYLGDIPNLAGVSGAQAPYMLWNFPDAARIVVNGGATIEGTLYAPNARLTWIPTQNVEGNVIAASFDHGLPLRRRTLPRELHDFPFDAALSCTAAPAPGHLSLVKEVVNVVPDDAEPSDWTLSATGPTTVTGPGNGPDVTGVEVPPGDYALAESDGPDGFVPGGWTCVGGALADDVVTVAPGSDVTCTIVNEAEPDTPPVTQLTLVKRVVNDDGGRAQDTDWTLVADGPTTPIQGVTGSDDVTRRDVDPGDYHLSETGPPGYTPSAWTCAPDSVAVDGSTVHLEPGDQAVCTIVNDDQAPAPTPSPSPPTSSPPAPSPPAPSPAPPSIAPGDAVDVPSASPAGAAAAPASAAPAGAGLADTGGPSMGLLVGGIVALGAGTVLLVRALRRP